MRSPYSLRPRARGLRRGRSRLSVNANGTGHGTLEALESRHVLAGEALVADIPAVVISEIMYHPASELDREEFIEVTNVGSSPVQLAGWRFTSGVSFTFPDVTLPAGHQLAVAADLAAFRTRYPQVTAVVGGWTGRLNNSSETVTLKDSIGVTVDEVQYADEGDWSERAVGPLHRGYRGWVWASPHDGLGKSLELVNLALDNSHATNWRSSFIDGGSPGTANSTAETNSAPLVTEVLQQPAIPRFTDSVLITTRLVDEQTTGVSAELHWRVDGTANFATLPLLDDGMHGDGSAGDGLFGAYIPPRPDKTVVEYYITTSDSGQRARRYPAQADPAQSPAANRLYQVDNSFAPTGSWTPGSQPVYRLVMTEKERSDLAAIGRNVDSSSKSDAQMNGTFLVVDGTGVTARYNVGIRNRGHGSRNGPPNNYRVNIPSDAPWNDRTELNINCRYVHSQLIGSAIYQLAGLVAPDATAAKVRVNAQDLAQPAGFMFGSYVLVEQMNSRGVSRHFPMDSDGNLYNAYRLDNGSDEADLTYDGPNADAYRNRYFKGTNQEEDDWSDLIALTDALNNAPDSRYVQVVSQHVHIDQWLRYLALDTLLLNRETSLSRGIGDDYSFYRGEHDRRFVLVPHDLDTLMQQGNPAGDINESIFTASQVDGLKRFLTHAEIVPRYYRQILDVIQTTFNPEKLNPLIDQLLGPFVPAANRTAMKNFVVNRSKAVLAQIPQTFRIDNRLPVTNGFPTTNLPATTLSGVANTMTTGSVMVDGRLAIFNPTSGQWQTATDPNQPEFETLSARGATWRYLDDGSNQATAWQSLDFDDSAWKQGPAQLGYGDNDEKTVINGGPDAARYITSYFRREFEVADPSAYQGLLLDLLRDDGAVVYLNGTELARSNMPAKPAAIGHQTLASSNVQTANENTYQRLTFSAESSLLRAGRNVLAVEIHQVNATSNDMSFDLGLQGLRSETARSALPLNPGINRVRVEAYSGPEGTGELVDSGFLDIVYTGSADGKVLHPEPAAPARLRMLTRDSYLPGTAMVVRIEAFDDQGQPLRDLWDATVRLATDRPDVQLSTYEVTLRNGVGSALVVPTGSGNFTLTASLRDLQVARQLVDLSPVVPTVVSGTLAGTSTTWSGVVRVTGDVTVPANHTLTIAPGTLVLFAGNATPLSTNGADLVVAGKVRSLGTEAQPVSLTALDPAAPWGEIRHQSSSGSEYRYTQVTRAGHAPRGGHTNTGPAIRSDNSSITFDHVDITDIAGKTMTASSSDLRFSHSQFARSAMGPEVEGSGLVFEDGFILDMLGIYREDGVTDDNDGIYIHRQKPGQTVRIARSLIAHTDDDGIDTLGSDTTLEDLIIRDLTNTQDDPKGITIINGVNTIRNVLMVNVDIGISAKGQGGTSPRSSNTVEHVTIQANSIGLQAQDKFGLPGAIIEFNVRNSIVAAPNPIATDYAPASIVVQHSNVVGETWSGMGNLNLDPLFMNSPQHNHRLQPGSPSIDAGDPASPLDADGSRADQGYYRNGVAGRIATQPGLAGTLTGTTILTPWAGPYVVTGAVTVPVGSTLVVLPGTNVQFKSNASLAIQGGRLLAEGTAHEPIRFTRVPGATKWGGIQFSNSMVDNRIRHAILEHGGTTNNQGMVGLDLSNLLVEHSTFDRCDRRRIRTQGSSLIVRESLFTDIFPGANEAPTTDNISEHIWGAAIPVDGHFLIENNVFGKLKGHNDGIDFDSPKAPNPIAVIRGNTFQGGGDDALDMTGDVLIEGNTFQAFHKDKYNTDPGNSNAISASGGTYTVVRNTFHDVDHVAIVKEGAFMDFGNNTVYGADRAAIYFDLAGQTSGPGRGAHVTASIFQDTPVPFSEVLPTTELRVDSSIVPAEGIALGEGNTSEDARFVDPANGDFRLRPGSPALGSGNHGLDRGSQIQHGASIGGEPAALTSSPTATLVVGGPGIAAYQYRVNGGDWSETRGVAVPIALTDLADGSYTVSVRGRDVAGIWQDVDEATVSRTWTVARSLRRIIISEVLAANRNTLDHFGTRPDLIELYNGGSAAVNLGGMILADGGEAPASFVLPSVVLNPGQYLTVYADTSATPGIHTGFGLDASGDSLTLYDHGPDHRQLDQVVFGPQVADLSLARVGQDESWALAQPTLGAANRAVRTGDPRRLTINEWLATHDIDFVDDFVELHNGDSLPVPLANLGLTDTVGFAQRIHRLPALSFIAANGQRAWIADGKDASGDDHVDFKLDFLHETLSLLDVDDSVIDRIVYQPQSHDVSQGRYSDGEATYAWYNLATPGISNLEAAQPRMQNLLANLRISEILYAPEGGSEYEFIEVRNLGAEPLDITGVRLGGGVQFTFPNRVLAAGAYAVVASDLVAFAQRYGDIQALAGAYAGRLDNGGESITLQLPAEFDAAVLRFRYEGDWYPQATADGRSLDFSYPNPAERVAYRYSSSWQASHRIAGTPGRAAINADFNGDASIDARDIDLLFAQVAAGIYTAKYDLNDDRLLDAKDKDEMITHVLGTMAGDANLDRQFTSADLVAVFSVGQYEDAVPDNSGWASGDWDGDGDFNTSDLVLAFQTGAYESDRGA